MKDTAEFVEQEVIQTDMRGLFRGAVNMMLETVLEEAVLELCGACGCQIPVRREIIGVFPSPLECDVHV